MPPHFENFSLNTLNSEQKPSAGRSTGDDFEIYRSGRVEKILTGSISVSQVSFSLIFDYLPGKFSSLAQISRNHR